MRNKREGIKAIKMAVVDYANKELKSYPEQKKRLLITIKNAEPKKDLEKAEKFETISKIKYNKLKKSRFIY